MIVRYRDLRRRDQRKSAFVANMKEISFEFRELICSKQGCSIDQERRQRLGLTMLGRMNIQHDIYECSLESGTCSVENGEA